jgi:hypothetical protein
MAQVRQIVGTAVGFIALTACLGAPLTGKPSAETPSSEQGQGPVVTGNPPPTAEQIRALTKRSIESQHRDDEALLQYARTEHSVTRKGDNGQIVTDIIERRVPSPAGDLKIKTEESGAPVSAEQYRAELEFAVHALENSEHPDERYREAADKYSKRLHDRAELVDTAARAFRITWAGRESRADSNAAHTERTLAKFFLDPNPDFRPASRFDAFFQHVHATIWVDEQQAQFARLEADIATDVNFGGGVAGKVYRGGRIMMEQSEVAPGIWLPTLFSYDVDGRKFLFAFGIHERAEISQYRRVGSPAQALEVLRDELNTLSAAKPSR